VVSSAVEPRAQAAVPYITGAYWFTSSTSFANPAVTVARSLTGTFAGIRPQDVPPFVLAQCVGAAVAAVLVRSQGERVSAADRRRSRKELKSMPDALNVLFICTGNSARSILAEALINHLAIGGGTFRGFSAGSHPKSEVHPLALELLADQKFPTDGLRSKNWDEFAGPGAPVMDFVFTVCDQAAGEACPFWPGQPYTAHWGVPDPAAVSGSPAEQRRAFKDALLVLRRRIELFASLPLEKLSRLAIGERLREIGRS
jgi:arsenate reductase